MKPDSLILSAATMDGKRAKTVEVGLENFEILQGYEVNNTCTKRHKRFFYLTRKKNMICNGTTALKHFWRKQYPETTPVIQNIFYLCSDPSGLTY